MLVRCSIIRHGISLSIIQTNLLFADCQVGLEVLPELQLIDRQQKSLESRRNRSPRLVTHDGCFRTFISIKVYHRGLEKKQVVYL